MDLMQLQHQGHIAVQDNDFSIRLTIKHLFPYYFYFNLQNYDRYVSYYVETLQNIENIYPELKSILMSTGLSVQAQDRYPLKTSIDQRGEQTINHDAKTSGGIGSFANSFSSILKWCLNRSDAAKAVGALYEMTELESSSTLHKELRPTQIIK